MKYFAYVDNEWLGHVLKDNSTDNEVINHALYHLKHPIHIHANTEKYPVLEIMRADINTEHQWIQPEGSLKKNKKNGEFYHIVKCSRCKVTGKLYTPYPFAFVAIDSKYRAKKYKNCLWDRSEFECVNLKTIWKLDSNEALTEQ